MATTNVRMAFFLALIVAASSVSATELQMDIDQAFMTDLAKTPITTEFTQFNSSNFGIYQDRFSPLKSARSNPVDTDEESVSLKLLDEQTAQVLARALSCGICKIDLKPGDTGIVMSPNFPDPYPDNMDCLWLLKTINIDTRIRLECTTIKLATCGYHSGTAPNWKDYLVISPLWTFKKSWVYCGAATTLTSIRHISICDKMAVTFRSGINANKYQGFNCSYTIF